MADLGSIGRGSLKYPNPDVVPNGRFILSGFVVGHLAGGIMGGQDFDQGNPTAPSLRMDAKGIWKFAWPVDTRQRTIFVDVMQAVNVSPRPRLVLCANSLVGVTQQTNDAASGTGWVTCSITFTPTATGYIVIVFESRYTAQFAQCSTYWDNFREVLV